MQIRRYLINASLAVAVIALAVEGVGWWMALRDGRAGMTPSAEAHGRTELNVRNRLLKRRLDALSPKGVYLVIDTARNVLYVKNDGKVIREAVASSGSGGLLIEPNGTRKWVFDTPRGEFAIESKKRQPVWMKPDWAFIEEGKPLPRNARDRLEEGVLGDFALGFGNAYFIHGTLYTRLLGKNVTHGCVRLGDEDLKHVYRVTDIGTKLYIY
jgi:lipoprotein-anchoring transpeptidase ErfK/SrfK